uniref:Uncharacterized protein AlNc14C174G8089 n=1 Tax=Albugo laibachii Nc14 TaxID=890382 RepID=F0WNT0_9STRA|nr:cleavage induced conserved hypothetical protein [Albugo laibachii Nc14]|eukprot:CCA22972.1 cleavage induced conserved hypothetical protein [Albugo laibachii Nc14]
MNEIRRASLQIETNLLGLEKDLQCHVMPQTLLQKATKIFADRFSSPSRPHEEPDSMPESWGNSVKREKFQDMDMLESGHAREYIAEECLSPTQSNTWTYTRVERKDKTEFRMYWNSDQFLLSAKQIGGSFYISQYEHFPEAQAPDSIPTENYCAVLRQVSESNFKLYSCGCEGCDMSFNTFSCCNTNESAVLSHEGADRQLLADITHHTKLAGEAGSEMRCFSVVIPAIMEDKRSRVIWCPRLSRSVTPSRGTPRNVLARELVTSPSPHNKQNRFTFEDLTGDRIRIESKLPVWCSQVNSLMLKFHGGRIREASSKNFMLMLDEDSKSKKDKLHKFSALERCEVDTDVQQVLMQFGKYSKSKFSLDFRYPLAPIQAFAIGLSSCAWANTRK